MSYDEKTDKMNWKGEYSWMAIAAVSGMALALIFIYFDKFPNVGFVMLMAVCCLGFYVLSILVRIQNHRGKALTGKTALNEKVLKYLFPVLGFGLGLTLIFF